MPVFLPIFVHGYVSSIAGNMLLARAGVGRCIVVGWGVNKWYFRYTLDPPADHRYTRGRVCNDPSLGQRERMRFVWPRLLFYISSQRSLVQQVMFVVTRGCNHRIHPYVSSVYNWPNRYYSTTGHRLGTGCAESRVPDFTVVSEFPPAFG